MTQRSDAASPCDSECEQTDAPEPAAGHAAPDHGWTLNDCQALVDDWIRSIGVRYFHPMTNLAQLVEEVGEVARILSRTAGEQSLKPGATLGELDDELADVLFVVMCLANQSGINLQQAMQRNLSKKTKRDLTRHRHNPKLQSEPNSVLGDTKHNLS